MCSKQIWAVTMLMTPVIASIAMPAFAKLRLVCQSINIQAPPKYVFEAIRKERDAKSSQRQTISYDGRVAKIDETMQNIPLFGTVHCVWEEKEFPYERIDYKLLESDKFKESYGSWLLSPSEDKQKTKLELKSFLDTNSKAPFSDQVTRLETSESEKTRLDRVKKSAEASYKHDESAGMKLSVTHLPK